MRNKFAKLKEQLAVFCEALAGSLLSTNTKHQMPF